MSGYVDRKKPQESGKIHFDVYVCINWIVNDTGAASEFIFEALWSRNNFWHAASKIHSYILGPCWPNYWNGISLSTAIWSSVSASEVQNKPWSNAKPTCKLYLDTQGLVYCRCLMDGQLAVKWLHHCPDG